LRANTEWLTWIQKVRLESLYDSELQPMLVESNNVKNLLEQLGETPKEQKKDNRMIMGDWLLQPGSVLFSVWHGEVTSVEFGFLINSLLEFSQQPYLGGKLNTGCGLVSIDVYDRSQPDTFLSIRNNTSRLSLQATEHLEAYNQYLSAYQDYLSEAQGSKDVSNFLAS